jgi:hypothetical protein
MAACTTTYFEAGRSLNARVAERNAEVLAQQPARRRGVPTPEFYFTRSAALQRHRKLVQR